MDTEAIRPGQEWPHRIRTALATSRYVFVIIGPIWLTAGMSEWGQRRIDNESDWVRLEIAAALGDPQKDSHSGFADPRRQDTAGPSCYPAMLPQSQRNKRWKSGVTIGITTSDTVTAMVNAGIEKEVAIDHPPGVSGRRVLERIVAGPSGCHRSRCDRCSPRWQKDCLNPYALRCISTTPSRTVARVLRLRSARSIARGATTVTGHRRWRSC